MESPYIDEMPVVGRDLTLLGTPPLFDIGL